MKVRKNVMDMMLWTLFQPFLEYFKSCKVEDPNLQYVLKVKEEGKPEHLFWSFPLCFLNDKYGDVVVFDTIYKVNAYDMSCRVLIGINNHGKSVFIGCALLQNETMAPFKWLKKIFSQAIFFFILFYYFYGRCGYIL